MRHGWINTRALAGPLMHPNGASDMVNGVVKTYEAGYKVWSEAYVPKLLFRPGMSLIWKVEIWSISRSQNLVVLGYWA